MKYCFYCKEETETVKGDCKQCGFSKTNKSCRRAMSECNHVWRVSGEYLPNSLRDRVATIDHEKLPWEFVWLRTGETTDGYDVCNKCNRAVRNKRSKLDDKNNR